MIGSLAKGGENHVDQKTTHSKKGDDEVWERFN